MTDIEKNKLRELISYCKSGELPYDEFERLVDINFFITLKSELFEQSQLLKEIAVSLRNGGYSENEEYGKLYNKIYKYIKP